MKGALLQKVLVRVKNKVNFTKRTRLNLPRSAKKTSAPSVQLQLRQRFCTSSYHCFFLMFLVLSWFPTAKNASIVQDIDLVLDNVPASRGYSIVGGFAIDKAGDLNGDGIGDVIIGDWTASSNKGVCYVVFGKKDFENTNMNVTARVTGFDTGFRIIGAAVDDKLGRAVSIAGDINGDGVSDVVVSAWEADLPGKVNAGILYVVYGRKVTSALNNAFTDIQLPTSALPSTVGFRILGAARNDRCCYAVQYAGDINGDGVDDIIAGSFDAVPNAQEVNTGIAYVIFGRNVTAAASNSFGDIQLLTTAFPSSVGFRIIGSLAGDWLGYSVGNAGDVNGDGVNDVIVGAVLADPPTRNNGGIAYVIFGRTVSANAANVFGDIRLPTSALPSSIGFRILGAAVDQQLGATSGVGDINGDGMDDIIVGCYYAMAGAAYVVYGRHVTVAANNAFTDIQLPTNTMPSTLGFRIIGAAVGDWAGTSARGTGDINGDGIADIIVGAPFSDPTASRTDAGIAYVLFGRDIAGGAAAFTDVFLSTFTASYTNGYRILGQNTNDRYGVYACGVGDVNGDGAMDIAVGGGAAFKSYIIYGTLYSPTSQPSSKPSRQPSEQPSRQPTGKPSAQPSRQPSRQPTTQPSRSPSRQPSSQPTVQPSTQPSSRPSSQPTRQPTRQPSMQPSAQPSYQPSRQPSAQPSRTPSSQPSSRPSSQPSSTPTTQPSGQPTSQPSIQPIFSPTSQPSLQPTRQPTVQPSANPSSAPTVQPSGLPSIQPIALPTTQPSSQPSNQPSVLPTAQPTSTPSMQPSAKPSGQPSSQPTRQPSVSPSQQPIGLPTLQPSAAPSGQPSSQPSARPSGQPFGKPSSQPTNQPSTQPLSQPTLQPSNQPSTVPTSQPSHQPSSAPSCVPMAQPSTQPTSLPTAQPTTQPTALPSNQPSSQPSLQPRAVPSSQPSVVPTALPTTDSNTWVSSSFEVRESMHTLSNNSVTWACGSGNTTAVCTVVNTLGSAVADYVFPWDKVTSIIPTSAATNSVIVSGRTVASLNVINSEIARCTVDPNQLSCSARTLHDTEYTTMTYVPFPNKIVYIGSHHAQTSITIVDATTDAIYTYLYSFSNVKSVTLLHVQAPPAYVGSFVSGTSVSVSGTANYIVAGTVRTDSGALTMTYFAPSTGIIRNSADLVNTMAQEYEHPDSFIAGGLQLSDNLGTHAYLVRVNALFGTVRYGVRYRPIGNSNVANDGSARRMMGGSNSVSSVTRGMVRVGTVLYMIVDVDHNGANNATSFSVLATDISTGQILQQVHVFGLNASISCTDITTGATEFLLIITCRIERGSFGAETALISTDIRAWFTKLPVGFTKQIQPLLESERVAFQRYALPVTTKATQITTTNYRFSTADNVPTLKPSVTPTLRPTVRPSSVPSGQPSSSPSAAPSVSLQPTSLPSTGGPTNTYKPTVKPTQRPTVASSKAPTVLPTAKPSITPTARPSAVPSTVPSTQPSPAPTTAPTRNPTVKVTLKPTCTPSARPTHAPSPIPTVALAAASVGYKKEETNSPLMIMVYIVAGLTGLWCVYKMLQCYLQALQRQKRTRKMRAELDTIPIAISPSPSNKPHLPEQQKARGASTGTGGGPRGAYANGAVVGTHGAHGAHGAHANTQVNDAVPNVTGSSGSSSSVLLSSLHSSEMSDISYSMNLDGQYSEDPSSRSKFSRSEESIMEEGGTYYSRGSLRIDNSSEESEGSNGEYFIDADVAMRNETSNHSGSKGSNVIGERYDSGGSSMN